MVLGECAHRICNDYGRQEWMARRREIRFCAAEGFGSVAAVSRPLRSLFIGLFRVACVVFFGIPRYGSGFLYLVLPRARCAGFAQNVRAVITSGNLS